MNKYMKHKIIEPKRFLFGQSMVEALVVVGVVVLLVTGLVSATTASLGVSRMSKNRAQALQYAKEGLEIVRIVKSASWDSIPQTTQKFCIAKEQNDLGAPLSACPYDIDNFFSRTVTISDSGICTAVNSCRNVTVMVSWKESGQDKSVTLTSFVTNWKTQQ